MNTYSPLRLLTEADRYWLVNTCHKNMFIELNSNKNQNIYLN